MSNERSIYDALREALDRIKMLEVVCKHALIQLEAAQIYLVGDPDHSVAIAAGMELVMREIRSALSHGSTPKGT